MFLRKKEKDPPDNIDVPAAAVAPSQFSAGVEEDSDSNDDNPTLQAACNPALDSGDEDEDEDEDSGLVSFAIFVTALPSHWTLVPISMHTV